MEITIILITFILGFILGGYAIHGMHVKNKAVEKEFESLNEKPTEESKNETHESEESAKVNVPPALVDPFKEIIKYLDQVDEKHDDIYSQLALLVSDINDVLVAAGDERNKQKEDCIHTWNEIGNTISML